MTKLKEITPTGFNSPTALPDSEERTREWQKMNIAWWQNHPMRYDWEKEIPYREFSREFYEEIDRRHFENSREYLNWQFIPFDALIDFSSLRDKDVLEIGVGNGSHAHLLARHAKSFTGIDITDYGVKSTSKRFKLFGLKGKVFKMDAESLKFPDNSFDFVWSWGVIHHSSNTERIIKEINRVLRPGGEAMIMVYHRGWWNYYSVGFLRSLLSGDLIRTKSLNKSIQLYTDGAIARYYSIKDWYLLVDNLFKVEYVRICGPKSDILLLPGGLLKEALTRLIPNRLSQFFTSVFRMGVFLVSRLNKRDG